MNMRKRRHHHGEEPDSGTWTRQWINPLDNWSTHQPLYLLQDLGHITNYHLLMEMMASHTQSLSLSLSPVSGTELLTQMVCANSG